MIFTSTTEFRIVGETLGQIGTGTINTITAPINPNVNAPYWSILATGWGSGWSAGNVLRFDTIGCNYPVDLARTVLQSNPSTLKDKFRIQVRGSIDNP